MREIELTQGRTALVDDEDYERVNRYKWCCDSKGYAIRNARINGKRTMLYMHRFIMDTPEGLQTDHINRNVRDNRKCNLRVCTAGQNKANTHKYRKSGATSKYKGVSKISGATKNPWRAMIMYNGKLIHIGCFSTELDAARAYEAASKKYFGEFTYKYTIEKEEVGQV